MVNVLACESRQMQLICLRVWSYLNQTNSRHGAHIPRSVKYVEQLAFGIAVDKKAVINYQQTPYWSGINKEFLE